MLIQSGTKQHSKRCLTHPTAKLFNHHQLLPLLNWQQSSVIWGATKGGKHQKKMVYAQTGAEMKFPGCFYFDETQPLPLLSPGASGQPAWDGFTFKNTCERAMGTEILCFTLMNAAR